MSKILIKYTLLAIMALSLFCTLLLSNPRDYYRDQVAVLMYHHVHDTATSSSTITTQLFRDQLTYLKNKGYHFINQSQFLHFMQGSPIPPNAVLVTFDDGYESFYLSALPILEDLEIPAVNFIITDTVDQPDIGNIPFLSRIQLKELADSTDLIDLECHTHGLHKKVDGQALLVSQIMKADGSQESLSEFRNRVVSDTQTCRRIIGEVSPGNGRTFAYPFGIYNNAAIQALKEGGIEYAFTIHPKIATRSSNKMLIPRINAGSPWITPEGLHNKLQRRVSTVKHPYDSVRVWEVMEEIGGELIRDNHSRKWKIRYKGETFRIGPDPMKAYRLQDGEEILVPLNRPVKMIGRELHMALYDLELLLGIPIYYDTVTSTYTTNPPEVIEGEVSVDSEEDIISKPWINKGKLPTN